MTTAEQDKPGEEPRNFVFQCPHRECGEPFAMTVETFVDMHGGAGYTCSYCGNIVVFTPQTMEEYDKLVGKGVRG